MDFYSKTIFFILAIMLFGYRADADNMLPELVDVAIQRVYIPSGFDTNDRTQVMIEGSLPNTCYRLGATETRFDESKNQFVIEQHAYFYSGSMCLLIVVPFNRTVDLGILKQGAYQVTDGHSGQAFGSLNVAEATNSGPDDHLYAMVDDVHLGVQSNVKAILVRGNLPGSCWFISEMKVVSENENVITVLPIMDYDHAPTVECTRMNTPFVTSAKLNMPLEKGRYMIQVRSLNGQSVNKLLDL